MKFSNLTFVLLSSVLVLSPAEVFAARGKPWRLDTQVDQRDLDAFIPIDARDMLSVPTSTTTIMTRGWFSWFRKDKMALEDIHVECPDQECLENIKRIKKRAQKNYNGDKNLNKGKWAEMYVEFKRTPSGITLVARLFRDKGSHPSKNGQGASMLWLFKHMKQI